MIATVISGTNNIFEVCTNENKILRVSLKGKILKTAERFYNALAPGDEVFLDENQKQITNICERKNYFARWNIKKNCPQILASNIDALAIVASVKTPPFHARFIDRALVSATAQNISPLILINKIDLQDVNDTDFFSRIENWKALGYKIFLLSAKEKKGFADFVKIISEKRIAFAGQSGVGKSSIINVLAGFSLQTTGEVSKKYERGTHTTTQGILLSLSLDEKIFAQKTSVEIIDTPGIRQMILHGISSRALQNYFPEFKNCSCSFGMKCTHTHEAGCAILEAVQNHRATPDRYESYLRMKSEIEASEKSYE